MRKLIRKSISLAAIGLLTGSALVGCGSNQISEGDAPSAHDHAHDHGAMGSHGDIGPHGGHLIELGRNHKYHAELVEDHDTHSVTVYLLDSHMHELAIGESSILLNLTFNGQTTSYELAAYVAGNETGSSKFIASDMALFHALESHGDVSGKLRVTIDGVPYVGLLTHHAHTHVGHAHTKDSHTH